MTLREIVVILLVFLAWLVPALLAARVASRKGREGANYLVAAFFVSGLVVLIVALAVKPVERADGLDPAGPS